MGKKTKQYLGLCNWQDELKLAYPNLRKEKTVVRPGTSKDLAVVQTAARMRDDIGYRKEPDFNVNKGGEVLQKVLVYLPFGYVSQLKARGDKLTNDKIDAN